MDMIEFTHAEDGMEKEYKKILRSELDLIYANSGNIRLKQVLNDRYKELHRREERYFEQIQHMMTEISLTKRALNEIDNNWNNKKYWGEE